MILYSLLTAERPYRLKREARGALEEAILNEEPLAPSRMAAGGVAAAMRGVTARKLAGLLKGDLDAIALKALKKPPGERYVTADAFEADIARYLRGEVVLAQRDRVVYRAAKFMRRHWVGIAAAGCGRRRGHERHPRGVAPGRAAGRLYAGSVERVP